MTRFAFVFVGLFLGFAPLNGQQEGSVAIAATITPTTETVVDDFANCVAKLVELKIPPNKATDNCKEVAKIASKQARGLASEASGAAKASRPQVIFGGRYGRYNSGAVIVGGGYYASPRYRTPRTIRPPRHYRNRP